MTAVIADGCIVGVALLLVAVEFLALRWWYRRTGQGYRPSTLFFRLAPGLCLMLALGAALRDAGAGAVGGWLTAAGLLHGIDLWRGWPRR